jgi:uncharacterized membrane protein (UPF0127 family)
MSRIVFYFILAAVLLSSSCSGQPPKQACFGGHCFTLEVVASPEERNQGLMFRKELGADNGMLFVFEKEDAYCFWMKNTYIPLDIIWLNSDKEVVFIAKNLQPCKEDPCPNTCPDKKAKSVLELNAGTCDKLGLRVGDYLILE